VSSPLVLATLAALGLNLVFRLGIRRKVTMSVDPAAADYREVGNFVERNAAIWGARRDVVTRVEFAVRRPLELTGQLPTQDEILESEEGAQRLAAFLVMQRSDKVKASAVDGVATLALHFRH
jgi:NCS2 family nucleobase:cation symporter-2